MTPVVLSTQDLTIQFGAISAVDRVSLQFTERELHAIIGPNGAGKTTLINLLSGELLPSAGTIRYLDRDISRLSADRVSRLGIGRSFQKTNIFPTFSCLQNCLLGAQSRLPHSLRFFRSADRLTAVRERALQSLALCGLAQRQDVVAAQMSYGEQRQLEIGMMLATEPQLLLLDEPLAGMGTEEAKKIIALIQMLKNEHTIILIEHDMQAVFAVADRLTVMVNGKAIATGPVDEIRANKAVQEAYFAEETDPDD